MMNPSNSQAHSLASYDSNSDYSESRSRKSMQSNASPLARSTSLNSEAHGIQDSDSNIQDSRSDSEVDVDSRWEVRYSSVPLCYYDSQLTPNVQASRRFVNPPPERRPVTSGHTVTTIRSGKSEQDDRYGSRM